MHIQVSSYAEAYNRLRPLLLLSDEVGPRGMVTKELLNVSIELTNPRSRLGWNIGRGFSLPFAIGEAALIFNATNSVEPIAFLNPRMRQFSDDLETLYGAYGPRISKYIHDLVIKLQVDRHSRQAILVIPTNEDVRVYTKDWPCTCVIQFMIRKEKLHMFVTMRSNDFIYGLPYDLFNYTSFQETMANELGVEVGTYYHTAQSLHLYEKHYELVESIERMDEVQFAHPYNIGDMIKLGVVTKNLKNSNMEEFTDIQGPYEWILEYYLRKKRSIEQRIMPKSMIWSRNFLKEARYDI